MQPLNLLIWLTRIHGDLPAMSARAGSHQCGFVLIPVLWAVGLLGFVAFLIAKTVALDARINANLSRQSEAEASADGLAQLAAYQLAISGGSIRKGQPLQTDGTPFVCRVGRAVASVEVLDTAGLIDINFASQTVLEQLLVGLDLAKNQATQLASAIIDFRSLDSSPASGRASTAQYLAAGRANGPKNAPFATVGELEQVLGMTRALFLRIRPFITIQSRRPSIDPSVASAKLLAMQQPIAAAQPKTAIRTFVIRVAVRNVAQALFVREAVVELSPRQPSGFWVREWNRMDQYEEPAGFPASGAPECIDTLLDLRPIEAEL